MTQNADNLIERIVSIGVVPLVTLNDVDEAVPLAEALLGGGVPIAEVAFRSDAAAGGMRRIHEQMKDVTLVAGTVHSVDAAKLAVDLGCEGIVTPAFNEDVVRWCLKNDVPVLPGTVTPTDIERAFDMGLRYVKFFPSEAYGGIKTLKALAGPFADMRFLPTGGVSLSNAADYMALPNVFAVGGSFPVPSAAQRAHDWTAVSEACRKAVEALR